MPSELLLALVAFLLVAIVSTFMAWWALERISRGRRRLREGSQPGTTRRTETAATLATEKARWASEAEQAVAAAVKQAEAEADERIATRERQWQAEAARMQEAAVQAARATAETEAAAALAAEKARWASEAEQAVAAAVKQAQRDVALQETRAAAEAGRFGVIVPARPFGGKQPQAEADERLATRERQWQAEAAERVRAGLARVKGQGRRFRRPRAEVSADALASVAELSTRQAASGQGRSPAGTE